MPYITRNKKGEIKSITVTASPKSNAEWIGPEQMEEVMGFLNRSRSSEDSYDILTSSDLEVIRVLEDLVDLLCDKRIIVFTELPESAQQKLGIRKQVRKNIEGPNLVKEDERIF
jgi:hypothetical protein